MFEHECDSCGGNNDGAGGDGPEFGHGRYLPIRRSPRGAAARPAAPGDGLLTQQVLENNHCCPANLLRLTFENPILFDPAGPGLVPFTPDRFGYTLRALKLLLRL